ncbi:hypothetical protein [Porphyromonas sp.]|uniref:hypothetical protein n=1 Tax=Porphyromonas sp. TaxID=1924944 RepID=UPI0026DA8E8D|nr:hypothetical protein [Porphyromonas sp.]
MAGSSKIATVTEKSGDHSHTYKSVVVAGDDPVESEDYILWVVTGPDNLRTIRQEHPNLEGKVYHRAYHQMPYNKRVESLPRLEMQLDNDYRGSLESLRGDQMEELVMFNLTPWEYRVTGVKDFKIVALSTLFGQPKETSLNRFFSIYQFEPQQVISYQTKELIWGYASESKLESIDQWLSLKPMAPPLIRFRLNSKPQEIPEKVSFVTILETTDGKILKDTTQVSLK